MLTPSESRRHATQDRRLRVIDAQIKALEESNPWPHLTVVDQCEAAQIFDDLKKERDELWGRFPGGDVTALFGDMSSLTYDRKQ